MFAHLFLCPQYETERKTQWHSALLFLQAFWQLLHTRRWHKSKLWKPNNTDKRLWLLWSGWMYLPYLSCSQFFFSTHFSLSCIKWNWRPCKCAVLWRDIAKSKLWNHLFSASSFDGNEWNEWTTFAVAASLLWVAFFSHFQFILIRQCSTSNMLNVISFLSEWHSHLPCFKCNSLKMMTGLAVIVFTREPFMNGHIERREKTKRAHFLDAFYSCSTECANTENVKCGLRDHCSKSHHIHCFETYYVWCAVNVFDVLPTGWNLFENLINLKLIMDFAGATQLQKETEKWAGILCIVLGKMTSAFNLVSVCFLVGSINEDEMDAHDTTHCIQFWAESIKSTPDERPTYGKMA